MRIPFKAMASACELVLAVDDEREALALAQAAIEEVTRVEFKFSRYRPDSILSRINAAAGGEAVACDEETWALLEYADALYRSSDGLFDISSGVLRRAWNFKEARLPGADELTALRRLIGWSRVERHAGRVRLPEAGMEIDFGGFGKEYAADRAGAILAAKGARHGYLNLAGDMRVLGPKPDGQPWLMGIRATETRSSPRFRSSGAGWPPAATTSVSSRSAGGATATSSTPAPENRSATGARSASSRRWPWSPATAAPSPCSRRPPDSPSSRPRAWTTSPSIDTAPSTRRAHRRPEAFARADFTPPRRRTAQMATTTGTSGNDAWRFSAAPAGTFTLDGLGGTDSLDMGPTLRSSYSITRAADGSVRVDSVSGASFALHGTLLNMEILYFNSQRDSLDLRTYFGDTTPPTVASYSPAAQASGVATNSDIVLSFSEAVQRGVGSITLTTAAGALVATYDAATSANLSLSGSTLTINPSADLAYGTAYTVQFAAGSVKDLAGNAYAGSSSYGFTTATGASIVGSAGNDTLSGTAGNDTISGGGGTDSVAYSGNLANYTVSRMGATYTVKDNVGSDGTDTLSNIAQLQFANMSVNLGVQADASTISPASLQRLEEFYVAFFNRVPDANGLMGWIDYFKAGHSLNEICDLFYSAGISFSSVTGYTATMTNADFVTLIYANVLGRTASNNPPSAAEVKAWADQLQAGTQSRGSLVNTMLDAAHTYKNDPTWGWVPDMLDNKITVSHHFAVTLGLNYNTANDSITHGMAIAGAVTPTDTSAAINLIGVNAAGMHLM